MQWLHVPCVDLWLAVLRAARPMPWKTWGIFHENARILMRFLFQKGEYDILDIHIDIHIHTHIERGCISVSILDIKQHIYVHILFSFAGVSVREYFIFHQFQLPDVG